MALVCTAKVKEQLILQMQLQSQAPHLRIVQKCFGHVCKPVPKTPHTASAHPDPDGTEQHSPAPEETQLPKVSTYLLRYRQIWFQTRANKPCLQLHYADLLTQPAVALGISTSHFITP